MSSVRVYQACLFLLAVLPGCLADHHEDECESADPCNDHDDCHQGCAWWLSRSSCEILATTTWEHFCKTSNPIFNPPLPMAYYCPAQCPDRDIEKILTRYEKGEKCAVWCKRLFSVHPNGNTACLRQPKSCGACDECQGVKQETHCASWCHDSPKTCWKFKQCQGCVDCVDPLVSHHVKYVKKNIDEVQADLIEQGRDCPGWCTGGDTINNEMPGTPVINCDFKKCQKCVPCRQGKAKDFPLQEVIYKGIKYTGMRYSEFESGGRRLENSTSVAGYVSV